MNADAAWDALSDAMGEYTPACTGRAMFTADRLTVGERALCEAICAACPIAVLCDAYATAASVDSGFWAGRDRSSKRHRVAPTR